MLYFYRKHRRIAALFLLIAGFALAFPLFTFAEKGATMQVRTLASLTQFLLLMPGMLMLLTPKDTFFRTCWLLAIGSCIMFAITVCIALNAVWAALMILICVLFIHIGFHPWIAQIFNHAEMRLPIIARDFWHMHEMIRRQKDDPRALQKLFASIDESELLFDRSWESGDTFSISAMDVREDLPLAGVFLQFEPQQLGDALIDALDEVVDAAVLSMRARLFGLSVCASAGTAQLMFYVQPGREQRVIRLLKNLIKRNGFRGDAVLLTNLARLAAERSLTPSEGAMETGILAARSGMFTRLDMDMTAVQTVYLQFAFDSREKAMTYMDAHREMRFVDMGYWDNKRGIYMVIIAVESDLRVESMARKVIPIRESGATLLDVETELDGLYRSEEEGSEKYWLAQE